jgi:hypothetical protein
MFRMSYNAFRFHLQGPFNVHAHDLSNGDTGKQAIHQPHLYFCKDLRCILGMISLLNIAVNNKPVVVCMSHAIVYNLCYVSHIL